MQPIRIVILGGTGFVGSHLVPKLAGAGHAVTALSRNREYHRELGVLPEVRIENADVYDRRQLERHFTGAGAVINLVGILNERGRDGSGFRKAHVELTADVIAACRAVGVPRLLQMSALKAGEGESHYLDTRGEAEVLVRASRLAWTIFQPSVIFGPGDGLFCRFAGLLRMVPALPLARANARFAPVWVEDVATAMTRALADKSANGATFQLFGPRVLTLREIAAWTAQLLGLKRRIVALPDFLGRAQAAVCDFVPGKPFSSDNFRSLLTDSIGEVDGLAALGIAATPPELIVPAILRGEDRQLRYTAYRAEALRR